MALRGVTCSLMKWTVDLVGNPALLRELSRGSSDFIRFVPSADETQFAVESSEFEKLTEPQAVEAVAERLLLQLSASASLLFGKRVVLRPGAVHSDNGQGGRGVFVKSSLTATASLEASATVTRADGSIVESTSPTDAIEWVRTALAHPPLAEVFGIWSSKEHTWPTMRNVVEQFEHALGGEKGIAARGWGVSATRLSRLKRTANSYAILGPDACHGVQTEDPPPKPMGREEAESVIETIMKAWAQDLTGKAPAKS